MRAEVMVLSLVLLASLAGCSGAPGPAAQPVPQLTFGAMSLQTVPLEPWEARGVIQLQWTAQEFAVWTQGEGGMPQRAVRVGDDLYTSDLGMGWTLWDLDAYVAAEGRGFRYLAWDVRGLLADATVTRVGDGVVEADSSFTARGARHAVALSIEHEAGAVRSVVITTPADLESPYTLTATAAPLPFSGKPPANAVDEGRVGALQDAASGNHARIVAWIDEYVTTLGRVPTSVNADALALQRLEEPWPTNPFDGRAVEAQAASGHFAWNVCTAQDAQYRGFGLDGEILGKSYGRGCSG